MKTRVFVLIIAFWLFKLQGQTYHPLISNKSIWTNSECFSIGSIQAHEIKKVAIKGDTVIQGNNYKKTYSDTSFQFNWNNSQYVCALREVNKKIYFVISGDVNEYLLYDFSKNVGDTLAIYPFFLMYSNSLSVSKLIIDSVDFVNVNGITRKRFKFNANGNYHMDEYWYEGIGSSFGILTPFLSVSDNSYALLCHSKNDTIVYHNSNPSNFLCSGPPQSYSCNYPIVSSVKSNLKDFSEIKIYPNPAKDHINVNVSFNQRYDVIIENALGQIIYKSKDNLGDQKINIDIFAKGFYNLRLQSLNNILNKKIIIE